MGYIHPPRRGFRYRPPNQNHQPQLTTAARSNLHHNEQRRAPPLPACLPHPDCFPATRLVTMNGKETKADQLRREAAEAKRKAVAAKKADPNGRKALAAKAASSKDSGAIKGMHQKVIAENKTTRCTFYPAENQTKKGGKGVKIIVNPVRVKTIAGAIALTNGKIQLVLGAPTKLYDLEGNTITEVSQLESGGKYICSMNKAFNAGMVPAKFEEY